MKKLLTLVVTALFLIGCSKSKEELAQETIQKYLSKTMNDFSSYESVEFGKLDSSFTTFDPTIIADTTIVADTTVYGDGYVPKVDSEDDFVELERKKFKPEFKGFQMTHIFRGKNSFGAKVVDEQLFYLNKDLSEVINVLSKKDLDN